MKLYFHCTQCGKEYFRYYTNKKPRVPTTPFCSVSCKGVWQSENMVGESNHNFGKAWSEDEKAAQALLVKSKVDDAYRENCAKANKGKKFSVERVSAMHENRDFNSYSRPHTDGSKRKIGEKSSAKFDCPEYRLKYRKTMEDRGYWVPLDQKEAFDIYSDAADWIANMFEDLSQEVANYVNSVGLFNTRTNQKGLVRDHVYSRKDGFDARVFPEIVRHPCNCEFILHSRNSSKSGKSHQTLSELFYKIRKYNGDWHEHQRVLDLLGSYEDGFRWDIGQFIEGVYSV